VPHDRVTLDGQEEDVPAADIRRVIDTAQAAEGDGLRVELGGNPVRGAQENEEGAAGTVSHTSTVAATDAAVDGVVTHVTGFHYAVFSCDEVPETGCGFFSNTSPK